MGRRKKLINNTGLPQDAIERVARCLLPDIIAYFESDEGKQAYREWEDEQKAEQNKHDEE